MLNAPLRQSSPEPLGLFFLWLRERGVLDRVGATAQHYPYGSTSQAPRNDVFVPGNDKLFVVMVPRFLCLGANPPSLFLFGLAQTCALRSLRARRSKGSHVICALLNTNNVACMTVKRL